MQPQTQPVEPQVGSKFTASDGTQLDPTVATLTRAIRQVESSKNYEAKGASGEFGAYQWMPNNFETAAKKYGLDPTDKSPVNQDKVAYQQIKEQLDAGHTQSQVASWWNSGKYDPTGNVGVNKQGVKYDTPSYVQNVQKAYQDNLSGNQTQQQSSGFVNPQNKTQTNNSFVTPPTQTSTPTGNGTPDQPKQGLLSKIGHGAIDVLNAIESPFMGLGAIPVQALAKATGQPDPYAGGIPGFAGSKVNVTPLNLEKKVGDVAQVGSYFVPGSGVLGAIGMGALQGGGSALSQGGDLAQVATQTGLGGAVGGILAGGTKLAGMGINKLGESMSGEGVNKAVQGIKDAYSKALNLNTGERAFESRSGKDLSEVLMKNEAPLGRYENGTLDASGAIEKLQTKLDPLNQQAEQLLTKPQGVVSNIPLSDILDQVKSRISSAKIPASQEKAMINQAQQFLSDEAEKYGNEVSPEVANKIKQGFQNSVFKKAITPEGKLTNNVQYIISDELKTATEKAVSGTDAGNVLPEINQQRSDLVDAIKRLSNLDGIRILKGGKLGNIAGGITGSIIGGASGGTAGALAGDYFGVRAAEFLNNPETRIAIAKGKATMQGLLPKALGKTAQPVGKAVSTVGNVVKKSARGVGLLGNLLTK